MGRKNFERGLLVLVMLACIVFTWFMGWQIENRKDQTET